MPRSLSSAAIARRLVAPPARMSSTTGARSRACRSAFRAMAARSGAPPLPARRIASMPFGLPSLHPARLRHRQRLLGPPGDRLALLLRHQRHDADGEVVRLGQVDRGEPHPASRSVSRKAALRDSRSSLAITSVAPVTLARCSALPSSGRSGLRPLSTSVKRAISVPPRCAHEPVDRQPLRLDPEPARALPRRRDPLVADDPHLRALRPELPNVPPAARYNWGNPMAGTPRGNRTKPSTAQMPLRSPFRRPAASSAASLEPSAPTTRWPASRQGRSWEGWPSALAA